MSGSGSLSASPTSLTGIACPGCVGCWSRRVARPFGITDPSSWARSDSRTLTVREPESNMLNVRFCTFARKET